MGRYHAAKLAACPGVELVGVLDADPARAKALAGQHGVGSFSRFDDAPSAEAAVVAVPTDRHHEVASAWPVRPAR